MFGLFGIFGVCVTLEGVGIPINKNEREIQLYI